MSKKLIAPLLLSVTLLFTGCGNLPKEPVTVDAFKTATTECELEVLEGDEYAAYLSEDLGMTIDEVIIAYDDDIEVGYYDTGANSTADLLINTVKENLEDSYSSSSHSSIALQNSQKFSLKTNDKEFYYYIVRVDDTLVYATTETGAIDKVDAFIEKINY